MNVLLDTHTFIWYIEGSFRLSKRARDVIESSENKLYFSIASLWELAIKIGMGKLNIQDSFHNLQNLLEQLDIEVLLITFADTEIYLTLPFHHRDPFDRMLISQAINRCLTVISRDVAFDAYNIQRLWL